MPVLSKQKIEDHPDHGISVPLNGNVLHRTLELYRRHHEECASRRKNGVDYEIRVEEQRSQCLRRKYMESLSQQQAINGRLDSTRTQLGSSSDTTVEVNLYQYL